MTGSRFLQADVDRSCFVLGYLTGAAGYVLSSKRQKDFQEVTANEADTIPSCFGKHQINFMSAIHDQASQKSI